MAKDGPYDTTARQERGVQALTDTWNVNHPDDPPISAQDYMAARWTSLVDGYAKDLPTDQQTTKDVLAALEAALATDDLAKIDEFLRAAGKK